MHMPPVFGKENNLFYLWLILSWGLFFFNRDNTGWYKENTQCKIRKGAIRSERIYSEIYKPFYCWFPLIEKFLATTYLHIFLLLQFFYYYPVFSTAEDTKDDYITILHDTLSSTWGELLLALIKLYTLFQLKTIDDIYRE